MIIRGLERYGKREMAREIAMEHLGRVAEVFAKTETVWENYAPDSAAPGKPAKRDFVGWTGIVPILCLIEYAVGLQCDAVHNRLTWQLVSAKRCGCERLRFNGHTVTLVADAPDGQPQTRRVTVESDGEFQLIVEWNALRRDFAVQKGKNTFRIE